MIGAEIVWVKMGSKVIGHVRDYGVPDCVERPTRVYWRKRVPQSGETMKELIGDELMKEDSLCKIIMYLVFLTLRVR